MTAPRDPLDDLRAGIVPVAPDAAFAARLRARLESALLNPRGATMSTTSEPMAIQATETSVGDVVYAALRVPDVARAEAFYTRVLGWHVETYDPTHRQIREVSPPMGMAGAPGEHTMHLAYAVDDLPATLSRIRAAGGQAGEPRDEPFGRIADCVDNQGIELSVVLAPTGERPGNARPGAGELFYLTVEVPDSTAFRDFYGAVFGWTFRPGRVADGWAVLGLSPMTGIRGGVPTPTVVPMYGVADIQAAVETVRAAGGTASDPERQPYGTTAECVDDQGTRFYLGQA